MNLIFFVAAIRVRYGVPVESSQISGCRTGSIAVSDAVTPVAFTTIPPALAGTVRTPNQPFLSVAAALEVATTAVGALASAIVTFADLGKAPGT